MRATGKLVDKIAREDSVALATKLTAKKEGNAKNEIAKETLKKKEKKSTNTKTSSRINSTKSKSRKIIPTTF